MRKFPRNYTKVAKTHFKVDISCMSLGDKLQVNGSHSTCVDFGWVAKW